jgi:hypothetical protein
MLPGQAEMIIGSAQATGAAPTSPTSPRGSAAVEVVAETLVATSTGVTGRRNGVRGVMAEKAPEGVGNSAGSRPSTFCGRRARKAKKSIQAKSTPRSVQDKNICITGREADGSFMGTSFFYYILPWQGQRARGPAKGSHHVKPHLISTSVPGKRYRKPNSFFLLKREQGTFIFQLAVIILDDEKLRYSCMRIWPRVTGIWVSCCST